MACLTRPVLKLDKRASMHAARLHKFLCAHVRFYENLNVFDKREVFGCGSVLNSCNPGGGCSAKDSSVNFIWALLLCRANSDLAAQFVATGGRNRSEWNLKEYRKWLEEQRKLKSHEEACDKELKFLVDELPQREAALSAKYSRAVNEFAKGFGGRPSYGSVFYETVEGLPGLPDSARFLLFAIGPDCGARSKRPFVNVFRQSTPDNVDPKPDGTYEYLAENPTRDQPQSTPVSILVLFMVFFRTMMINHIEQVEKAQLIQIGLSVFNHDVDTAQLALAMARRAFRHVEFLAGKATPMELRMSVLDPNPEKRAAMIEAYDRHEWELHHQCNDAFKQLLLKYLKEIDKIPCAHMVSSPKLLKGCGSAGLGYERIQLVFESFEGPLEDLLEHLISEDFLQLMKVPAARGTAVGSSSVTSSQAGYLAGGEVR